jgi:hypothetical protein
VGRPSAEPGIERVWRRHAGASRRWQPGALLALGAFVAFGLFAARQADDPEAMRFIGGVGGLLAFLLLIAPWLLGAARRADAELTFDGSTLRCGRQRDIPAHDVQGWRVLRGTQTVEGTGPNSSIPYLRLEVIHRDGRSSTFTWDYPHARDEGALREAMVTRFGTELAPPPTS